MMLTVLLGVLFLMTLYNALTAPRLEATGAALEGPLVSVCVPARDEAANLSTTLPRLLASEYRNVEVLVFDDDSTDGTGDIAAALGARVLRGETLPSGWLGKNRACHRLAMEARGEILLFCDADVSASPEAIGRTVTRLAKVSAVTALPRQELGSWSERAVLPLVMHVPPLALLPLGRVPRLRSQRALVANGQWLAVHRRAYLAAGGHAAVREEVVEDMALARNIIASGGSVAPVVAAVDLDVRMYRGAEALREGFGKNLYALVGGTFSSLVIAVTAAVITLLVPFFAESWLPLVFLVGIRLLAAHTFAAPLRTVLWHPVGVVLALALLMESSRGTARWKGRVLGAPYAEKRDHPT